MGMGIHPVTAVLFFAILSAGGLLGYQSENIIVGVGGAGIAVLVLLTIRVARQWQKAVVLRMGEYLDLKGPGVFWVIPFVDTIPYWVDLRTITTPFTAEA